MALFGRGKSGGLMNVIRCDQQDYLVWKWRPEGAELNSSSRENSIRYGSSLRVKDGEMAVFVYQQDNGTLQDFIYGPYDGTVKTANLPVLTSIVGLAYGGESPFQADIYFINLAGVVQIKFGVPYFDVFDPRFLDFAVPVSVGGTLTFKIDNPEDFIKKHRLINFSLEELKAQVKDAVSRRVKSEVSNMPERSGMPVVQIERKIATINDIVEERMREDLADFGVALKRLDISRIEIDKSSEGYGKLRAVTAEQQEATIAAQTAVNIKNLADMQAINARNIDESMRIQREETQRAQRLQTETQFIGAHALNRQADVMQTAAESLGSGGMGGATGSSGINPAQFMTGMAMGGALGGQMAGIVNSMGQQMNAQWQQAVQTPPPVPGAAPAVEFYLAVGGRQSGPFAIDVLQQMAHQNQIDAQTLVWKPGMAQWAPAATVAELAALFMPPAGGAPMPPPIP